MATPSPRRPILVVDDEPSDLLLMERAMAKLELTRPLATASDGEQAIAWLQRVLDGEAPAPALVILDLKMPRVSGFEVLEWIGQQPGLRRLPVVVCSSSTRDVDVTRAYDLGANGYLVKPVRFRALLDQVSRVVAFWCDLNHVPDVQREVPAATRAPRTPQD